MRHSPFLLSLYLQLFCESALSVLGTVSAQEFDKLNKTVGGRLFQGSPLARPCFPIFDGAPNSSNDTTCSVIQSAYTSPELRAPSFGAYMQPEWETCQRTWRHCLLDSSNPSNPLAFENRTCFQGSVAPYYIDVRDANDVKAAFAFAGRTGIKLSIKNSGHDYKGRSSGRDTLGLWVHHLNNISYDGHFVPEGCQGGSTFRAVTTGTGTTWRDAYAFADKNNVTLIGPYHETVAAAGGWLMGGGHSVLSPVYGLGVDRVLQIKIVTPDGRLRVANTCQNSDLFWALRGGGGGTFGVVLEATYKAERQMSLQVASLAFNRTRDNLPGFYSTIVNNSLKWGQEGWGGHISSTTFIYVNPLLTLEEAKASMKPLTDWIHAQNGLVVIETLPSWNAFFEKYVLSAQAAVGTPLVSTTRILPTDLFESDEGRNGLLGLLLYLSQFNLPYVPVTTPLLYNATDGSTSVTPAWRSGLWSFGTRGTWNYNSSISEIKEQYVFTHNFTETLRSIAPNSGAYFNEGDVYEPDHERSYWGPNYSLLLEIKNKYDPYHLLGCWQCVGWKGPSDERYSCYLPEPLITDDMDYQ